MMTMDVRSLYTNIDHDEGMEACIEKLETRKKYLYTIKNNRIIDTTRPKIKRFPIRRHYVPENYGDCNGDAYGS